MAAKVLLGLAAGVMYYGDSGRQGERPSDFVTELRSQEDLDAFISGSNKDDKILTVIDVSLTTATPCIHIFPAVLALAKNFTGYARFARLMGDASPAMQDIIRSLNVVEVGHPLLPLALASSGHMPLPLPCHGWYQALLP